MVVAFGGNIALGQPGGFARAWPSEHGKALNVGRAAGVGHCARPAGESYVKVCSAAVNGIEAYPVEVEVNAGWGDTIVVIVGLPDTAVKESRDRVSTALTDSGFKFPMGMTTINLAPADVKKEGPSFDLPTAVGMLAAREQMESAQLENFILTGELALTGAVRPVKGVLPIALRARAEGKTGVVVPCENAPEAAVVQGLQVIPVQNLREAVGFLEAEVKIAPTHVDVAALFEQRFEDDLDFAEVKVRIWPVP
jgi:magnesium chelatase family protein